MAGAAAVGIQIDVTASEMTKAIVEIVSSSHFDKAEIRAEKLTLSQAFCLLWQDAVSGDVGGRKFGIETNGGAAAAVLVDLVVLGKAEVEVQPNTTLGIKNDTILFKVLNDTPTGTYLDGAIFDSIVKKYNKKPDKPDKVKDWISIDVSQLQSKNQCATCTLESLVDLGILDKKKKMIGNKYPTVRPGIEENLVKLIRAVALDGQEPSSYIRALLTLTRTADNLLCSVDPVLQKHFSKEEYVNAKKRINALVGLGKKGKGKYQAV